MSRQTGEDQASWPRRTKRGVAVGGAALLTTMGGVAWATIPSADGSIKGCYARTNGLILGVPHSKGDVRIVDSGESCRSYETLITWSQQGAMGPAGTAGPAGPAGSSSTASSFVSNHVAYTLPNGNLNSTDISIGDLASMNSDVADHQITTTFPGRIMVTAGVQVQNPDTIAKRGACRLFISDGTGPQNGLTEMGRPVIWYTQPDPASNVAVPVIGAAQKPPGTYNVVVRCQQLNFAGATVALMENMMVVATS